MQPNEQKTGATLLNTGSSCFKPRICLAALAAVKLAAVKKRGRKGKESTEVGQFKPAAGEARSKRFPAALPLREGSSLFELEHGRYVYP